MTSCLSSAPFVHRLLSEDNVKSVGLEFKIWVVDVSTYVHRLLSEDNVKSVGLEFKIWVVDVST